MAKFKNISPLGDLDIPSLGITVKAGDTFEVSDEPAIASLQLQVDVFAPVDSKTSKPAPAAAATDSPAAPAAAADTTDSPAAPAATA